MKIVVAIFSIQILWGVFGVLTLFLSIRFRHRSLGVGSGQKSIRKTFYFGILGLCYGISMIVSPLLCDCIDVYTADQKEMLKQTIILVLYPFPLSLALFTVFWIIIRLRQRLQIE